MKQLCLAIAALAIMATAASAQIIIGVPHEHHDRGEHRSSGWERHDDRDHDRDRHRHHHHHDDEDYE